MTLGTDGWEQNRNRIGLAFLLLGVVLLLWTWVSWAYRTGTSAGAAAAMVQADQKVAREQAAKSLPTLLMVGVLLILVFLVGTLALRRGSRALRETGHRRRGGPTPAEDVWLTHHPPPLDVEDVEPGDER